LRKRASVLLALGATLTAAVFLTAGGASAHPAQHGPDTGHLTGTGAWGNIEFLGRADVTDTADLVADVTVNPAGTYAFLANWGEECTVSETGGTNIPDAGAWVVDIRDLKNPKKVGFIPAHQDSRPGEGMQVVNITTSAYSGDVLVMNNEQYCTNVKSQGKGDVSLWDVRNPLKPVKLAENWGDRGFADVHDIHSAYAWDAGSRAYVVIVDNFEWPDVDILDITNPKRPRLIAEYDLRIENVAQPEIGLSNQNTFIHDMIVKKIGDRFIMLISYWDGGYVKMDVTSPANAVFLGDTDYAAVDPLLKKRTGIELTPEGNAHQAEFTLDNRYFIGTDEDFDAYRATAFTITSGPSAGTEHQTAPTGGGAPVTILDDKKLNGPTVYGGYGCPVGSAPIPPRSSVFPAGSLAPGEEAIVVLQRGPTNDPSAPEGACFPGEKAAMGKAAGYDAVVLVARHTDGTAAGDNPPFCGSGAFPAEPIVALCTTHEAYHLMFNTAPAYDVPYVASKEPTIGTVGAKVEVGSIFDGWGYVHLFNANTLVDLDQFAIPEAHDPAFAVGFGDLSVHEVATDPDEANRAYLSYYSGGVRALQIRSGKLVESGGYLDPKGNDFWGVETFIRNGRTIILGSDRDDGLWIFGQK
jgi:hypothetical protein